MKKVLKYFTVICLLVFTFAVVASAKVCGGNCGENGSNVKWRLDTDTGVFEMSGYGATAEWITPPWSGLEEHIKTAIIGNGITNIGFSSFFDCYNMTSVTIPSSVTSIGHAAFRHCYGLTSITIPSSVTSIGTGAFSRCESLTSITIPGSLTEVSPGAFEGCYSLKTVIIQDGVTSIGHEAFFESFNLISIIIPESVTNIGNNVFDLADELTISCTKDSYAYRYATENNIAVSLMDDDEKTVVKMIIGFQYGYINGVEKRLDAPPIIREDRTLLPVRFVTEAFGATVSWDGQTSTATIRTKDVTVEITIGKTTATVNGTEVPLDSPAIIVESRTYMPVRFIAEALGAIVSWDGLTRTATLIK